MLLNNFVLFFLIDLCTFVYLVVTSFKSLGLIYVYHKNSECNMTNLNADLCTVQCFQLDTVLEWRMHVHAVVCNSVGEFLEAKCTNSL